MSHSIQRRVFAVIATLSFVLPAATLLAPSAGALPSSVKVAMLGSDPSINGGGLYHSDPAFAQFTFTDITPADVTSVASLAAYDTVVLHVAGASLGCSTGSLSAAAKTALNQFVQGGGKLIIHDSECTSTDYTWVDFPFTTNNPGALGAAGTVSIVEDDSLGCSNPAASCFIDVGALGTQTDAIGDSNVVVTKDANWCGHMKASNANSVVGFDHMYAIEGPGLFIYNGMDEDYLTTPSGTTGSAYLAKLWLLELKQPWSPAGLPCSSPVICDATTPAIALSIDRPALGFDYFNDAATPQSPVRPVSRVIGSLTVTASSSDPSLTQSLDIFIDGTVRASFTAAPFSFVWNSNLEPVVGGTHTILVRAIPTTLGHCPVSVSRQVFVPPFSQEALARGLFVGVASPESNDLQTAGASVGDATGHDNRTTVDQDRPDLQARARIFNDTADTLGTATSEQATATSVAARVDLLNGLITSESLRANAAASLSRSTFAGTATGSATFTHLVIADQTLANDQPANTRVDLGGGSYVMLNEQKVDATPGHQEIVVNALHVYLQSEATRNEIIVGQAHVGVDLLRGAFASRLHDIDDQNDAGLGRDASNDFAHADPVPMHVMDANGNGQAAFSGRVSGSDLYDYYSVVAKPGQKLQAALVPSDRFAESVQRIHVDPEDHQIGYTEDLGALSFSMLEPGSAVARVSSPYVGLGIPQHEELNVDVAGAWVLVVYHVGSIPTNYTLSVTVSPLQFLPDDQVVGPDAPASCAGAITPTTEVIPGVMTGNDRSDFWAVHADIGDTLTGTLKSGEDADGVDFDLYLYDSACNLVQASTLGKGIIPKGTPDVVAWLGVPVTGTYFVEVRRANGIGNYALDLRATKPIPTFVANDGLSGADAPSGCTGVALPVSAGLYEGTMTDGDTGDTYTFQLPPGKQASITLTVQPGNAMQLQVGDGACQVVATTNAGLFPAMTTVGPTLAGGTFSIRVLPIAGGGNYLFTLAER